MSAGVVVSLLEGMSGREAADTVDLAADFSDCGVVGVDLAGDESLFDAGRYAGALAGAKQAGLGVTVHAGESGEVSHVLEAVRTLGADRIGHGVAAATDRSAMALLAERNVTVEVCLSSNLHTGAVGSLEEHPLRVLDDAGVPLALATDNRFFSDTALSREYELAAFESGADRGLIERSVVASADAAFLPEAEREALRELYATGLGAPRRSAG